jgi:hypothetical protein
MFSFKSLYAIFQDIIGLTTNTDSDTIPLLSLTPRESPNKLFPVQRSEPATGSTAIRTKYEFLTKSLYTIQEETTEPYEVDESTRGLLTHRSGAGNISARESSTNNLGDFVDS